MPCIFEPMHMRVHRFLIGNLVWYGVCSKKSALSISNPVMHVILDSNALHEGAQELQAVGLSFV
jgi:hypothetical protein